MCVSLLVIGLACLGGKIGIVLCAASFFSVTFVLLIEQANNTKNPFLILCQKIDSL